MVEFFRFFCLDPFTKFCEEEKLIQNPTKISIFQYQNSENPLNFRLLSLNKWTVLIQFWWFSKSFLYSFSKNCFHTHAVFSYLQYTHDQEKKAYLSFLVVTAPWGIFFGVRSFLSLFFYPCVFSDLCTIHKNRIPVQHEKWNILLYRNTDLCLFSVFLEGLMGVQLLKNLWMWFQLLNSCYIKGILSILWQKLHPLYHVPFIALWWLY